LITPEEAQQFLATMRDKSKKEGIDHKPPTNISADGVDAWYMQQRHREQELRLRRKEAAELLRGYRAPYRDDGSIEFGVSPRYGRGRASLNNLSESLVDPASPSGRRRSAMPRMQQGGDQREDDNGERDGRYEGHERQQFGPERFDFLREQSSYSNEQYDRQCIAEGRDSFPGDLGDPNFLSPEQQPRRFQSRPNLNIDTSASQNRLRDADAMKRQVQFSASMDTSSLAPIPETVWRDFISPGT
jgi:hypothetical protein